MDYQRATEHNKRCPPGQVKGDPTVVTGLDKPVVISDGSPLTLHCEAKWFQADRRDVKPNPPNGTVHPDPKDPPRGCQNNPGERACAATDAGGLFFFYTCGNEFKLVIVFAEHSNGQVHTITASTTASTSGTRSNLTIESDQHDCIFQTKNDDHDLEYRRAGTPVQGYITFVQYDDKPQIPATHPTKVAINHS